MKNKLFIFSLIFLSGLFYSCNDATAPIDEPSDSAPVIKLETDSKIVVDLSEETVVIKGEITSESKLSAVRYYKFEGGQPVSTENVSSFPDPNKYNFSRTVYLTEKLTKFSITALSANGKEAVSDIEITVTNDGGKPGEPGSEDVLAFPGAQGGAAYITGGRGGKVIYVTTLNDSGEGSLRWALQQSGARTVLFKVAGIISLNSDLKITNGNLTVAGQSAPGDGICIRNYPVVVQASNVIIRFIRFRMGDERGTEADALWGRNQKNMMIDHCSMSWSTDECSSFYDIENFTMQWCILSESLRISVHGKGQHGYGAIWGGKNASFHHNLLAHHDSRNPRFCGSRYSNKPEQEKVDFRNNVIYNWSANSGYGGEGGYYNMVNNYYKYGPATGSSRRSRIFQAYADDGKNSQPAGVHGHFYLDGNYVDGNSGVTSNNWNGFDVDAKATSSYGLKKDDFKADSEFDFFTMQPKSAQEAYNGVLAKSGASCKRDPIDARIVEEVKNRSYTYTGSQGSKNGLIDSQADVGGWPVYTFNTADVLPDSDNDGIPDGWLGDNYPGKTANDKNGEGYTYLEIYLNSLVNHLY
jgi:hypothetical protein